MRRRGIAVRRFWRAIRRLGARRRRVGIHSPAVRAVWRAIRGSSLLHDRLVQIERLPALDPLRILERLRAACLPAIARESLLVLLCTEALPSAARVVLERLWLPRARGRRLGERTRCPIRGVGSACPAIRREGMKAVRLRAAIFLYARLRA